MLASFSIGFHHFIEAIKFFCYYAQCCSFHNQSLLFYIVP
nr:MAG TPA: hypothetical protein [Caudoviricetes sp.]DAT19393.1 MAG TPA: hypothetical protein [Caudoviricetes sp.]